MLNRNQIYTLLMFRAKKNNIFSNFPLELIKKMSDVGWDNNSEIAKLLHYVAYGEEELARVMIQANPRLLLQAGNVRTPAGLKLKRVTPFECALGGGDPEMAAMMIWYFSWMDKGKQEYEEQYERYYPHIKNMLKEPDDLNELMEIIKKSTLEDLNAELKDVKDYHSDLRLALNTFREKFKSGTMVKPGMHFNYASLQHAYDICHREHDYLVKNGNCNKLLFFRWQVIGFLLRNLPARDRQIYAQRLDEIVEGKQAERTVEFVDEKGFFFPVITKDDSSHTGLGFDSWIDVCFGGCVMDIACFSEEDARLLRQRLELRPSLVLQFISSKQTQLLNVIPKKTFGCTLL